MKKALIAPIALTAMLGLVACGDDSSGTTDPKTDDSAAASVDDLGNCTTKKIGEVGAVLEKDAEEPTNYVCADFGGKVKWVEVAEIAETSDDFKVCNKSKKGDFAFATEDEQLYVCQDEEWEEVSSDDTGDGDDDGDGDDTGDDDSGKSSSSASKTNSSASKEKVVEFVDGIIWQPSYGKRAWTNAEGVDEYNFNDEKTDDEAPGWWYKYIDLVPSKASGNFTDNFLKLDFTLEYGTWERHTGSGTDIDGYSYTYYWYEPKVYPYAGFGFSWDENPVSMIGFSKDGLCVTYSATTPIRFQITTQALEDSDADYQYSLPASTAVKTVDVAWTKFELPSWYKESAPSVSTAITKALALHFVFSNDESGVTAACGSESVAYCEEYAASHNTSTLKIYKIGKYGKCSDDDSGDTGSDL